MKMKMYDDTKYTIIIIWIEREKENKQMKMWREKNSCHHTRWERRKKTQEQIQRWRITMSPKERSKLFHFCFALYYFSLSFALALSFSVISLLLLVSTMASSAVFQLTREKRTCFLILLNNVKWLQWARRAHDGDINCKYFAISSSFSSSTFPSFSFFHILN